MAGAELTGAATLLKAVGRQRGAGRGAAPVVSQEAHGAAEIAANTHSLGHTAARRHPGQAFSSGIVNIAYVL